MRTTVDLEEDVLLADKEIAKRRGSTLGKVLSDLARQTLTRRAYMSKKPILPVGFTQHAHIVLFRQQVLNSIAENGIIVNQENCEGHRKLFTVAGPRLS
jgi:hypothetical protein